MTEYEASVPFARATINRHAVTLNRWNPTLIGIGPRNRLLDDLDEGIVIADLTIERREDANELIVAPIAGRLVEEPLDRLVRWAGDAGYLRIWLSDRVVDLGPADAPLGPATTSCPTCGTTWSDRSPEFLVGVRRSGFFPPVCLACGGSLPEWAVEEESTGEMLAFCHAEAQNEGSDFSAS
jgi:hypothetical protein